MAAGFEEADLRSGGAAADGEAGAVAVAQGGGRVERRGRQAGLGGERA
jgi:hypothetical protein